LDVVIDLTSEHRATALCGLRGEAFIHSLQLCRIFHEKPRLTETVEPIRDKGEKVGEMVRRYLVN
jgi:hypothetical protein